MGEPCTQLTEPVVLNGSQRETRLPQAKNASLKSIMHKKIAFIKTGWSEDYRGGPVFGRHGHIEEYNEAHERFNFLRAPDGRYYGYTPPLGDKYRPPQPVDCHSWLLIFVAAKMGTGPLTVVGWYENASFEKEYEPRPEYKTEEAFETDIHGEQFVYCFSAAKATLIPCHLRDTAVSGRHLGSTSIAYVRGTDKQDGWRDELAEIAEKIVDRLGMVSPGAPAVSAPNSKHIKAVEQAAIDCAMQHFQKDYIIADRQKDNCGYDLLLVHKKTKKELHVEVKGTSSSMMNFFITRNEWNYMSHPCWRLFMVTDALIDPNGVLLTRAAASKLFDFDALCWEASLKPRLQP